MSHLAEGQSSPRCSCMVGAQCLMGPGLTNVEERKTEGEQGISLQRCQQPGASTCSPGMGTSTGHTQAGTIKHIHLLGHVGVQPAHPNMAHG